MRFYLGEIYECATANCIHKALVVKLTDNGTTAVLRPFKGGGDFTAFWVDLLKDGWERSVQGESAY